jgi:Na+-translocating ferredoxin:NAD+ oxidoreductase RnfE subunit
MRTIIFMLAGIGVFVTSIIILINAFRENVYWGLGSFFTPFVLYIYAKKFWKKNRRPMIYHGASFGLVFMSIAIQTIYHPSPF